MSEETTIMLNTINDKVRKCIEDNNVDNLYIPIGMYGEFGFLTNKMVNEIINLQKEKQQLKEQLNQKITPNELVDMLNQELLNQLKQRDEVIENAIEYVEKQQVSEKNLYTANVILDLCCDLKEIFKGDNNE